MTRSWAGAEGLGAGWRERYRARKSSLQIQGSNRQLTIGKRKITQRTPLPQYQHDAKHSHDSLVIQSASQHTIPSSLQLICTSRQSYPTWHCHTRTGTCSAGVSRHRMGGRGREEMVVSKGQCCHRSGCIHKNDGLYLKMMCSNITSSSRMGAAANSNEGIRTWARGCSLCVL
ncbi:hypothetical protein BDZ94DRAFT_1274047, partial [Collybia nuda]